MEMMLAVLTGAFVGPLVTELLKLIPKVSQKLGATINLGATLALYLVAWWLWTGADRALAEKYFLWACAASGLAGAGVNLYRKKLLSR